MSVNPFDHLAVNVDVHGVRLERLRMRFGLWLIRVGVKLLSPKATLTIGNQPAP